MLQHYPSPQGNGTVLLCQSVQQLRRLLPAYYWLGCFLFNFKIFRSKTTEKNLALSPLTRFLQVCDHWLFNSTTFLQLLPKTRLMNRCVEKESVSQDTRKTCDYGHHFRIFGRPTNGCAEFGSSTEDRVSPYVNIAEP